MNLPLPLPVERAIKKLGADLSLARRFGPLPLWAEAKLGQAGQSQLEAWADRVLDAATLEDMFAED